MLDFRKCALGLILLGALGCRSLSTQEFDALQRISVALAHARQDYVVQPGDTVKVLVYRGAQIAPGFDQTILIQPDGKFTLLNVSAPVDTQGLTVSQLQAKVKAAYIPYFVREQNQTIEVTVQLLTSTKTQWIPDQVYITGQVRKPVAIPYRRGMTLMQVMADSGGWNYIANEARTVVMRTNDEGKTISREVDLRAVVEHRGDDIELFPGDVVYIPLSWIGEVDLWIELYIRALLPINPSIIRTFSTGFF